MQNPYLFVVGCPRSGTTLLQRMLDSHPYLAVANDTHFIPRALKRFKAPPHTPLTAELVAWVHAYRRFSRLGLSAQAVEAAARAATYRDFIVALYDAFGAAKGKPLAGEKTPDYCRNLPLLHTLFPWARTLHIIRDGRDVALSTLEWTTPNKGPGKLALWQQEPVATCALWWTWQVTAGRRDGAAQGASLYHELRYEDLVADPEQVLRTACSFLHLPYSPEMVAFYAGKTRQAPGLSAKSAWLPATQGLRDWRSQMSERDLILFEALAGDLLTAMGYERAVRKIPPDLAAVAARCREWWIHAKGRAVRYATPPASSPR